MFERILKGPQLFSVLASPSFFHAGTVFGSGKTSDYLLLGNFVYTVSVEHLPRLHIKLNFHMSSFSDLNVCISGFKGCLHFLLKMK